MTSHSDNFNAGGVPIFLIVTFILAVIVTRNEVWIAFRASRTAGLASTLLFMGSVCSAFLSCFLYLTAAWGYGLVCTIFCYVFALIVTSPEAQTTLGKPLMLAQAVWFLMLIGVPSTLSAGVISTIRNQCITFYGEQQDKMCRTGWLAFCEIVAMFLISVVFLSLLTLLAKAITIARQPPAPAESTVGTPNYRDLQSQLHAA
jgi:heme/copper-type cytochrome/quinol oxidase subunit 4